MKCLFLVFNNEAINGNIFDRRMLTCMFNKNIEISFKLNDDVGHRFVNEGPWTTEGYVKRGSTKTTKGIFVPIQISST
jgi:hypothetical protein